MNSLSKTAAILMACALSVCVFTAAPPANAAPAGKMFVSAGKSVSKSVVEVRHRHRGPRIVAPIAPSYLAFDYPLYFSRGYYPTHIGPGYIYYGHPYNYERAYYPRHSSRCAYGHRKCGAKWGYKHAHY